MYFLWTPLDKGVRGQVYLFASDKTFLGRKFTDANLVRLGELPEGMGKNEPNQTRTARYKAEKTKTAGSCLLSHLATDQKKKS